MPKLITVKFETPFKIGRGETYIDAFTLYRAFIKALSMLGEDFREIVENKVKFSSAFPVINGKLFLKVPPKKVNVKDRILEKKLKKVEYISQDLLKEVLEKKKDLSKVEIKVIEVSKDDEDNDLIGITIDGVPAHVYKNVIVRNKEEKVEIKGDYVTEYKNRISRVSQMSDIFTIVGYFPHYTMGFIVSDWNDKLERALRLLEKTGIGGERSIGFGKFKVVEERNTDTNIANGEKDRIKYATGRVYTEGEFVTERLEKISGYAGDTLVTVMPQLILLPAGSLLKESKRIGENINQNKNINQNNIVIVDPILL